MQDETASQAAGTRSRRKLVLGGLGLFFLLCGIGFGVYWFMVGRYEQSTDDAYVSGNLVPLTPRVNGTVVAIRADDTQLVRQGEPVVVLDSTDALIALEQAESQLAQTVRQVQQLYQTAAQLKASVALRQAQLAQTQIDFRRRHNLVDKGYISVEDSQHTGTQVDVDRANLALAQHQLAATEALVKNTNLPDHPDVKLAAAKVRDAYVALQRTTIVAPVTGYVAKRSVQVGQRVSPGTPLLAIVPLNQIWVDANFKESQLGDIRVGQPVTLETDVYGGHVRYHGAVAGLGAGTGSVFAVLPPQNATGNWIKVVQRVPVRIALDPAQVEQHPLRVGLSVEATVDTHTRSGAMLGDDPVLPSGYATPVFNDEAKGANALIAQIIRNNTVTQQPAGVTTAQRASGSGTP